MTGLVAGAGCGGGGTAAAPRPPAVAALIAKLQARDARIRTAYLPYGIVESGPRAGAPSTGWWALDGGRSASFDARRAQRFVWSGGVQVTVPAAGDAEFDDQDAVDFPTDLRLPAGWGLGTGISSWAALLAWSPRVEVLGRETVAGRDCVKVVCDTPSEAPAPPGGWANPVLVWFDDGGSGLAMRYEVLVPSGSLARVGPGQEAPVAVNLGDANRFVFIRYEVGETTEIGDGITLPRVTVYTLPALTGSTTSTIRLADGAWINRPVDPAWFAVPPRPLTRGQRNAIQVGLIGGGVLLALAGWWLWQRRRRRRDPPWPTVEDPESRRAYAAIRRLAWMAPMVAVVDLVQKLALAVPMAGWSFTRIAGESMLVRAAFSSTIVLGTGLLAVSALRLDRALRRDPAHAPGAVVLAAVAGIAGGLPWVALVGGAVAERIMWGGWATIPWHYRALELGAVALQLPLALVGVLAALWWPRVARATAGAPPA